MAHIGTVKVDTRGERMIASGQFSVQRSWAGGASHRFRPGDPVTLVDSRGRYLASALSEDDPEIAFRIFSRNQEEAFDQELLKCHLASAVKLRERVIPASGTSAYRLFHGEGDGLPGIALDVYGDYRVLQLYSTALARHRSMILEALETLFHPRGIVVTDRTAGPAASRSDRAHGRLAAGEAPPPDLTVLEAGLKFGIELTGGYDTGLFLDNRENRIALARYVKDRSVLNLFSYTGSISVHCAAAGASRVTSVDISERALGRSKRNLEMNGLSPSDHPHRKADALEYLRRGANRGRLEDVVVLDPPSFSTSKKNVFSTEKDYPRLAALALEVLAPGGILVAVSNHRKTTPDRFLSSLSDVSRQTGRPLRLLEMRGAGPDFPVPLSTPEAAYLKVAILARD